MSTFWNYVYTNSTIWKYAHKKFQILEFCKHKRSTFWNFIQNTFKSPLFKLKMWTILTRKFRQALISLIYLILLFRQKIEFATYYYIYYTFGNENMWHKVLHIGGVCTHHILQSLNCKKSYCTTSDTCCFIITDDFRF